MATSPQDGVQEEAANPKRRPLLGGLHPPLVRLVIALGLLTFAGSFVLVYHQRQTLRDDALAYLDAVANLKAEEIAAWLSERRGGAEVAARTWVFARALEERAQGREQFAAEVQAELRLIKGAYNYRGVYLLDGANRVAFGTDVGAGIVQPDALELVQRAHRSRRARLERFWRGPGTPAFIDAVAPVFGTGAASRTVVGTVLLRTEPTSTLWPLLLEWPAGSRPFVLTLATPGGDDMVAFYDANRKDDHAGTRRPALNTRLAEAMALRREPDLSDAVDVSGARVMAAARRVHGADWLVVAKSSRADIYAPATRMAWFVLGWLALLLAFGLSVARGYSRRMSERAVRQNEERLRISQALAHAGTWDWDARRGTLVCSDEFWRLVGGRPAGGANGRALLSRVPREDRRVLVRALRVARAGQAGVSLEHPLRRLDGERRLVQHEARSYADPTGAMTRMIGVIVDVTERRRAEHALFASEETFKNIVENMQDAFMATELGGDGRILRVNSAAVRLLGYASADQLIGKSMIHEITVNLGDREALKNRLMEAGVARDQRSIFRRADGSHVSVEGNVRLVRDKDGRPVSIEGVVRDMSAHDQRQAELIAAREAAIEAAQLKSRFLANMSHEIRTPLNAVVGLSHLLLKDSLPARQRDYVHKIQGSARMLLEVINSVLDFSKIEAGKLVIESTSFFLDEVLENVSNVLAVQAQEKGLELVFALGEGVPVALQGDPLRLGQVLTNLTHNAIKFTSAGAVVVGVEADSVSQTHASLRFSIRDTGIGISSEQVSRLFEPFTQADGSASRRFGGTGLGLAISRQLVQLMGGHIQVDSTPEKGSTFSFSLEFELRPQVTALPAPSLGRGLRALLVDDHQVSRLVLERYLRDLAVDPASASAGGEALALLLAAERAGQPFDLILLDWKMPEMDGLELARRIRSGMLLHSPPTIVMVTAHDSEALSQQVREVGIEAMLVKPVTRSALQDAIAAVLGQLAPRPRDSRGDGEAAANLRGTCVLVAEDNVINQQVARELLEGVGVKVLIAGNGREACAMLSVAERVDAILMDLQMPEMDGYEATREIRKAARHRDLPIIAMTAHTLTLERDRCREAGMNDHVAKPVDPAKLYAVLGRWIGGAPQAAPVAANPPARLQVAGVDTDSALRRLGGNEALLRRLLGELARQWRDGTAFTTRLAQAAPDQARLIVHDLKGVAANLGVDEVAAAARELETALAAAPPVLAPATMARLGAALAAACAAIDAQL